MKELGSLEIHIKFNLEICVMGLEVQIRYRTLILHENIVLNNPDILNRICFDRDLLFVTVTQQLLSGIYIASLRLHLVQTDFFAIKCLENNKPCYEC